jgi:hypothetical protein
MNSFNQTNPISNYRDLVQNLQNIGNNIQTTRGKLINLLIQLLQNPKLKPLVINNISLINKYLTIQIQINTTLKKTFKFIPYIDTYYNFIIDLNQNILIKITTLKAILETSDNTKIEQYINSFSNIEMGGIYMTLGDKMRGITADSLEQIADTVRTFDATKFIKTAKSSLENLQSTLKDQVSGLKDRLNTITQPTSPQPSAPPLEEDIQPIPEGHKLIHFENPEGHQPSRLNTPSLLSYETISKPSIQSAGGKYNKIFHPEYNRWVDTRSCAGIDALLKYAYFN